MDKALAVLQHCSNDPVSATLCFNPQVHPNVHFVADTHAYMMEKNEVIGWLGGWFDDVNKILYVQARCLAFSPDSSAVPGMAHPPA